MGLEDRNRVRPEQAGPGPSPHRPSSPAHSCTVLALQDSRWQTPWPCVPVAPGCPLGVGVVAGGAGGCPGGAAPSGRTAGWCTMYPAELVGDREAGGMVDTVKQSPCSCSAPGLTLILCAEYEHPLAGDDLELVVLATAGHLYGSQRDHALGKGVLESQNSHVVGRGTQ